ncbi:putative YbaB/EbfC family nucleoid-associated protein [Candidatus Hepatincolaceae symbiont of Richtersius coronifer]
MNGAYDIISIELKDNPDTDMALEIGDIPSLIIAAYNDARKKIKDISEEKMKSLTSGISLPPGMKMPGLF